VSKPILRTKWLEIYPSFGFRLEYCTCFSDNDTGTVSICLGFPHIFINIPFKHVPTEKYDFEGGQYGFYWHEHNFVVCWGKHSKHFEMPYVETFVSSFVHNNDETWFNDTKWDDQLANKSNVHTESYPYTYVLRDGTVQNRIATCTLRKHIRQVKFFKWLKSSWFIKENIWVDVKFNDEIGEQSGSWKGGCTGCAFDMEPGRTVEWGLRKMERTRKF